MPQEALVFRLLVASPSDCVQERKAIPEVIHAWNAAHSLARGVMLEPVRWETHSRPELGDRPQGILNKQLVERCDVLVAAFWTRLGTHTGQAESGTAEEILEFRRAGKPVLLYFSSVPVVPDSVDAEQYAALNDYRRTLEAEGIVSRYDNIGELREQLYRHLSSLDLLRGSDTDRSEPAPGRQEAALAAFTEEFESFRRRLEAEWEAERTSDPVSTEDGKYILERAAEEVLNFLGRIKSSSSPRLRDLLREVVRIARSLQRHEAYMDGGRSFAEFWNQGDSMLRLLGEVTQELQHAAREDSAGEPESLAEQEEQILRLLSQEEVAALTAEDIGRRLHESTQKTKFFLERLLDRNLIIDRLVIGSPIRYQLARSGRSHLVEKGFL